MGREDGEFSAKLLFVMTAHVSVSTNGTVHFSYAHLKDTESTASQVFFTRQLSYPVMVTVYQMLECHGMDILPFPSYPLGSDNSVVTKQHLDVDDESSWCLFSIDVRNTYGLPFDVTLERTVEGLHQFWLGNFC